MGMFSWLCKGCGHELKSGEFVRMNGCVGEYDGYGRAGGFHYEIEDPSCWHVRCYKNATNEEKLDDNPSQHAQNQGFGFAALENMKGYDPEQKILFKPVVYSSHYDGIAEKSTRQEWYIVDGILMDQYKYEALYEAAQHISDPMLTSRSEDWYNSTSESEQISFYEHVENAIQQHIGMKKPSANATIFDDFDHAKTTIEALVPSLPNTEWGCDLAIFGKQGKIEGLYYLFNKTPGFNMVPILGLFLPNGKQKVNFVFNGEFEEKLEFMHNTPVSVDVDSY